MNPIRSKNQPLRCSQRPATAATDRKTPGDRDLWRSPRHPHTHPVRETGGCSGQAERDIAISTGHSDTRMVAYYDRGRDNISRNSTHAVSAWIEGAV